MLKQALTVLIGGVLCGSLLWFDHLLGNGFMDMMNLLYCKCFCFVKRTLRDQAKAVDRTDSISGDFNGLILALEMAALLCTMVLLNRYKKHGMGRANKHGDKETNELLEKQRRQRISRSMDFGRSPEVSSVSSPQHIQPLNVEIPVLHMAIIDTYGTTRSQPERGDAGDIYNTTDSAILSVTSLLDRDFQLPESVPEDSTMDLGEGNTVQYNNNRYLWDVIEEE